MKKILFTLLLITMVFGQFDNTIAGWYGGDYYVPDGKVYSEGIVVVDESTLAAESLDEVDFATHATWDVTNDFDDTGGNAAYTWSANQTSTLTQIQANLTVAGVSDRWYAFTYTVAVTTAFDGDGAATITTGFALTAQTLDLTAGTHTLYFKSKTTPTDFVISVVSGSDTEGTFTIDDVTLKQITGGDIDVQGLYTGGGSSGIKVLSNGNVVIGTRTSNPGGKLEIDGDSDMTQLIVKQNATQTSPTIIIENSTGTEISRWHSDHINSLFIGTSAGAANTYLSPTEGAQNTFVGAFAGTSNITGYALSAFGHSALRSNQTGSGNVAMGYQALYNTVGNYNTALGVDAGASNTTGFGNTYIGWHNGTNFSTMSTGNYNTFVGDQIGEDMTIAHDNTILGSRAGNNIITAHTNVIVGSTSGALQSDSSPLTAPVKSIYIGAGAKGFNDSDSNSIVIGYNAIGKGANTAVWGNTTVDNHYFNGDVNFTLSNDAATPTLNFGDGNSGFYEAADNNIRMSIGGVFAYNYLGTYIATANGARFINEVSTSTNPVFTPTTDDVDTGLGGTDDQLVVVAGGVTAQKWTENVGVLITYQLNAGLTADVGSIQGGQPLTSSYNEISVCANIGDSVTLPTAAAGQKVTIINNGANAADVFPASGDDLGAGADTASSLAAGSNITYFAINSTNWEVI